MFNKHFYYNSRRIKLWYRGSIDKFQTERQRQKPKRRLTRFKNGRLTFVKLWEHKENFRNKTTFNQFAWVLYNVCVQFHSNHHGVIYSMVVFLWQTASTKIWQENWTWTRNKAKKLLFPTSMSQLFLKDICIGNGCKFARIVTSTGKLPVNIFFKGGSGLQ